MANEQNPVMTDLNSIISMVMDAIFAPDQRRIDSVADKMITRLCDESNELFRSPADCGISYQTLRLTHSSNRAKSSRGRPVYWFTPTSESDLKIVQDILKDVQSIKKDYAAIRQLMVQLLSGMNTLQDIRDVLPDEIVSYLDKGVSALPRTREPAYRFKGDTKRMELYATLEPKILGYIAAKFFF